MTHKNAFEELKSWNHIGAKAAISAAETSISMQRKRKNIYLWFWDEFSPLEILLLLLFKIRRLHYRHDCWKCNQRNLQLAVWLHDLTKCFYFQSCSRQPRLMVTEVTLLEAMYQMSCSFLLEPHKALYIFFSTYAERRPVNTFPL